MANGTSLNTVTPYQPPEMDTDIGEFNMPELPTAAGYQAPEAYTPTYEETTAGQISGLLAEDSPYIQAARKSGERTAQQRGLLSSSIAAGAAQRSAIESALPIAAQDAATIAAMRQAEQQGRISGALQTQAQTGEFAQTGFQAQLSDIMAGRESEREAKAMQYQAGVQAGLSAQEAAQRAGLSAQEAQQAQQLSAQQAGQAAALDVQQQEFANLRQQNELAAQQAIAQAQLGSQERRTYSDIVNSLGQNYQQMLMNIQTATNVANTHKVELVKELTAVYEANMQNVASIYNVDISW